MSLLAGFMGGLKGLGDGMNEVGTAMIEKKAQAERDNRQNEFQTQRDERQNEFQTQRDSLNNDRQIALEKMRKENNLAVEGVRHSNALTENTHVDGLKRETGYNPESGQWEEYKVGPDGKPTFLGVQVGKPASETPGTPSREYLNPADEKELDSIKAQLSELRKMDTTTMSSEAIAARNADIQKLQGRETEILNSARGVKRPSPSSLISGTQKTNPDNFVMQSSGNNPGLLNNPPPKEAPAIDPNIMVDRGAEGNPDKPATREATDWVRKVFENNAEFWGQVAQPFKDAAQTALLDLQRITKTLPRDVQVELGNVRRLMEQGAPVNPSVLESLDGKVDFVTLGHIKRYIEEQAKTQ